MASPTTTRKQRLRKTKAQLVDEIEMLELRAAAIEATNRNGAPMRAKARDRYLATQELADLARFPSENPSPVLRVMPDGTVLYANDAAIAVNGLLKGRKKSTLVRDLAGACAEASGTAEVQETEFESGDRVFAFSIAPVTGKSYINIYGRDVTDGHNTRLALEAANEASAAAEARLKTIIDNSPATICLKDAKGRYQLVNKHFTELHGMTADAMLGKTAHELFPKEIAGPFRAHDRLVLRTGVAEEREQVVTTPGGPRTFNEIKFPITANGEQSMVNTIGLIATDITKRKRAEEELVLKEAHLRAALDNMPGGIRLIDGNRNFVLSNQQYIDLYDLPEGLLKVGDSTRVENLYCARRGDFGPGDPERLVDKWLSITTEQTERYDWERTLESGKVLQVNTAPLPDRGVVNVVTDITERKRAEEKIRNMAHYDNLTQLPNRALFRDRLNNAITFAERNKHNIALLFIDLDGFKMVNDTLGHSAGDQLLMQVAERLKKSVRKSDTIARLGGDEFAIVIIDAKDSANVAAKVKQMIESVEAPYPDIGELCKFGCSIGIALLPDDAGDTDSLLKKADEAMYVVKRHGKNGYCFYRNMSAYVSEH